MGVLFDFWKSQVLRKEKNDERRETAPIQTQPTET
jgi:hypothetical protein